MANLTIEYFWHCPTFEEFGPVEVASSERPFTYRILFGELSGAERERQGAQRGWICNCKGFKSKGRCKHVELVESERCGWSQFVSSEEPLSLDGRPHCPRCRLPAQSMGWGA